MQQNIERKSSAFLGNMFFMGIEKETTKLSTQMDLINFSLKRNQHFALATCLF